MILVQTNLKLLEILSNNSDRIRNVSSGNTDWLGDVGGKQEGLSDSRETLKIFCGIKQVGGKG